jgi:hypothetical protein
MIYTLGCSFTKWYWPTWADWLSLYKKEPVKNLAYPGFTNDLIYYQIIDLLPTLTSCDEIFIMWTGSNRICQWYDRDWIDQTCSQDFFPASNGKLWFTPDTHYWQGMYKTHPEFQPSLTHMMIHNIDTWYKTQLALESINFKNYKMMFWQNPWADVRETWKPEYKTTWNDKTFLSKDEVSFANQIMSIQPVKHLLNQIHWDRFVEPPSVIQDPNKWNSLWDFVLNNKTLILSGHDSDPHPSPLSHHNWLTEKVLKVDPIYTDLAIKFSKDCVNLEIPKWDSVSSVTGHNAALHTMLEI